MSTGYKLYFVYCPQSNVCSLTLKTWKSLKAYFTTLGSVTLLIHYYYQPSHFTLKDFFVWLLQFAAKIIQYVFHTMAVKSPFALTRCGQVQSALNIYFEFEKYNYTLKATVMCSRTGCSRSSPGIFEANTTHICPGVGLEVEASLHGLHSC